MTKFKVGDKVRVKTFLEDVYDDLDDDCLDNNGYDSDMEEYEGETVTISGIYDRYDDGRSLYGVKEDVHSCEWDEECFEQLKSFKEKVMERLKNDI